MINPATGSGLDHIDESECAPVVAVGLIEYGIRIGTVGVETSFDVGQIKRAAEEAIVRVAVSRARVDIRRRMIEMVEAGIIRISFDSVAEPMAINVTSRARVINCNVPCAHI